ncbi:MAG: glycosyltransferase, partial [Nitrososphaera sp.]
MTEILSCPVISVVIPLYREGAHLASTLPEIIAVLSTLNTPYEIVLVDDGSPDNTWQAMLEQREQYPQVNCARLSRNFGKEAALAAG